MSLLHITLVPHYALIPHSMTIALPVWCGSSHWVTLQHYTKCIDSGNATVMPMVIHAAWCGHNAWMQWTCGVFKGPFSGICHLL